MIINLYGEDSYRRNLKVRELIGAYKDKHPSIDMAVFDLDDDSDAWRAARDFLSQPSMFAEAKLAVIKEAQEVSEKEWIKILKNYLEAEKIFVVISGRKAPGKDFAFLKKNPVKFQEFKELEGSLLSASLEKEADRRGIKFSKEARLFLLAYLNESKERSALVANELDRIYLHSSGREVSGKDLEKLIRFEKKEAVWKVGSEILRERSLFRRLGLLERIFLQREAPSYIFNSLGFQARGRAAQKLADLDVSVKSGGLEYEEALTDFVLSV